MAYFRVRPGIVDVDNHNSLIAAWNAYGWTGLVKTFRCRTPLTARQIRRLPAGLRSKLGSR